MDLKTTTHKDLCRIDGIIERAQGWKAKELRLASNMAASIKDVAKAERRGQAALIAGRREMAIIFFKRAGQLAA